MGLNSPEEYNRIFGIRQKKGADHQDLRRWKVLLKYFKGGRLLDAGCLDSQVPVMAKKKFANANVWGIDTAKEAIQAMQTNHPSIKYEVRNVYDTRFPDNFFDYVVAGELIEHLESPQAFIKEAFRILKPKGTLALSTPLNEEIEFGAVDGHRHLWSFSVDSVTKMLKVYGKIKGVKILGSEWFPYKYHFPTQIVFAQKHD